MKIQSTPFLPWWYENCNDYRALLFDIDGTLIHGENALPGATEMIDWLRNHHFPFSLLTNDGNHSLEEKSFLLQQAGLKIEPEEIVSCSLALHRWVDQNHCSGLPFFVMGDLGNPNYAELAGLTVCRDVRQLHDCEGIIVGEGFYDWQETITAVMNSLRYRPERPLLVPNPDSYWPSGKKGEIGIGAGGKARFICSLLAEMGISIVPVYLGKPYPAIYEHTLTLMKKRFAIDADLPPASIMMLGDSLKSDIQGARQMGMTATLLLTGITQPEQLKKKSGSGMDPHLVFSSIR